MYCSLCVSCLYVYDMDVVRGEPSSKESGGTIMNSWCIVSLARKRLGAQLRQLRAWSAWLVRVWGHNMDRYVCEYVHINYGMDSVCPLSVSLTRCCIPFQVTVQEYIKGKPQVDSR